MRLSAALSKLSQKFGGPWKFLLMNLRGGQVQGAILTLSIFAWLISSLNGHSLHVTSTDMTVLVIAVYLATYILASMLATHLYFGRSWLAYGNMVGDIVAMAGSIAVAVLLHPSAASCSVHIIKVEGEMLSMGDATKACSLQKVTFAANITNSLMFFLTIVLQLFSESKRYRTPKVHIEKVSEDQIDRRPCCNDHFAPPESRARV